MNQELKNLRNFVKVNDLLYCSGQPSEAQLALLASDKVETVVNLGLLNQEYSLADEGKSLKEYGLSYFHIPVQFDHPEIKDLQVFFDVMGQSLGKKTLVHCAANYRASTFTGLYLLSKKELDEDGLHDFIYNVWTPNTVWQPFIEEAINFIKGNRNDF